MVCMYGDYKIYLYSINVCVCVCEDFNDFEHVLLVRHNESCGRKHQAIRLIRLQQELYGHSISLILSRGQEWLDEMEIAASAVAWFLWCSC